MIKLTNCLEPASFVATPTMHSNAMLGDVIVDNKCMHFYLWLADGGKYICFGCDEEVKL